MGYFISPLLLAMRRFLSHSGSWRICSSFTTSSIRKTLAGEQYDEVVKQVGTLVDELVVGAVCSFYNRLNGFFSNLLRHLVHAFLEEAGGVAALRHLLVALVDEVLQALRGRG